MTATTPIYRARDYGHRPGGPADLPIRRILAAANRDLGPTVPIVIRFDDDFSVADPLLVDRDHVAMTFDGRLVVDMPPSPPS